MKRFIPCILALVLILPSLAAARADNIVSNNIAIIKLCEVSKGADPAGCALLKVRRTLVPVTYARHMFAELYRLGKRGYADVAPQADHLYKRWAGHLGQGKGPGPFGWNAGVLLETALIRRLEACKAAGQNPCPVMQGQGHALLKETAAFLKQADISYAGDWRYIGNINVE